MITKDYLKRVQWLKGRIARKEEELEILEEERGTMGNFSAEEKVQSSRSVDKVGTLAIEIVMLEKEITSMKQQYISQKQQLSRQLDEVKDEKQYSVLHMKYLQGQTISSIAEKLNYSERQINNIHKKALVEFERINGKDYLTKTFH